MSPKKSATARWAWLWAHIAYYVIANVIQVFVWWYATPDLPFWPLWSIAFWGLGVAFHIWAVVRRRPSTVPS